MAFADKFTGPLFAQPGDTIGAGFKAATRPQEAAATHKPGMDNGTGRCMTCDSRRCPTSGCTAREGYVWAPSVGWVSPERAAMLENGGETVYWDDVWHD